MTIKENSIFEIIYFLWAIQTQKNIVPTIKTIAIPVRDWRKNKNTKSQMEIIEYRNFSNFDSLTFPENKKYHNEKIDIFISRANLICEINNEISRISWISTFIKPNNAAVLIKEFIVTELIKNKRIIFISLKFKSSDVPITNGRISNGNLILMSLIA